MSTVTFLGFFPWKIVAIVTPLKVVVRKRQYVYKHPQKDIFTLSFTVPRHAKTIQISMRRKNISPSS